LPYKSIEAILRALEGATLCRFIPLLDPHETERRELWVRTPLHKWLYQGDRKATVHFKPNVRAFLGRFVKGEWVDNRDYMKCWKADVWELRVQLQPTREATRIFGAFVKPDAFLAIHQRPRNKFGGKEDPAWDRAIDRVIQEWDQLFPGLRRVPAKPFSNCVTFNGDDHDTY
jgi:hypothetical protein